MKTVVLSISNCIDCPFHKVLADPDPDDWFCDDDMKVVCTHPQCKDIKKEITCACRPYNLRKESDIPKWCPLSKTTKEIQSKPFIENSKH